MKSLTILLAEDHVVVREGIRAFLETVEDVQVLGEATTGREAVTLARTLRPAVIVMDVAMPRLNGLEATRQILRDNPAARVLVLSASSAEEQVVQMIEAGAAGFVEKQRSGQTLLQAIREVAAGNAFFSRPIARRLLRITAQAGRRRAAPARLTSRQQEVLQLIAEGSPNKAIAAELGISIKTVCKHREQLMARLDIHDTAGLTRYAISSGAIEGKP